MDATQELTKRIFEDGYEAAIKEWQERIEDATEFQIEAISLGQVTEANIWSTEADRLCAALRQARSL